MNDENDRNDETASKRDERRTRSKIGAARVLAALALAGALGGVLPAQAAPLDLNRASMAELEALPGIGAAKAAAIIEERQVRPFSSVEDLERVRGIGPALVTQLRDQVTATAPAPEKGR